MNILELVSDILYADIGKRNIISTKSIHTGKIRVKGWYLYTLYKLFNNIMDKL